MNSRSFRHPIKFIRKKQNDNSALIFHIHQAERGYYEQYLLINSVSQLRLGH